MNRMLHIAVSQSVRALTRNIGRTMLTMLGIVIGISTVILVLSAGEGFRSLIDSIVDSYGSNTLFVQVKVPPTTKNRAASQSAQDFQSVASGVTITSLKERDLDEIMKLPNVKNAYGVVTGSAPTAYRNNKKSIIYYGAGAERAEIDQTALAAGRFFTKAEDTSGAQVAVLGSGLVSLFGQDDPIGKTLRVGTLNFQVIGVYEAKGAISGEDDILYIPLATAQKKLLGVDHLLFGVIQLENDELGEATAEQIRVLLRRNHDITDPVKDDFSVQTQAQAMESFNAIFGGITALLIAIAAISLIVGGVGIMNIMYVVVTERTAEVGLKKALGARGEDILSEFLVEAVLVTVAGGVIGIVLGSALGWLVSVIATAANLDWTFIVPPYAIAIGFGVSAAIGIGFGVLPARSAAKLDPIEALRYE